MSIYRLVKGRFNGKGFSRQSKSSPEALSAYFRYAPMTPLEKLRVGKELLLKEVLTK